MKTLTIREARKGLSHPELMFADTDEVLVVCRSKPVALRECDAMQLLIITSTTHYPNHLSLQANLKDYAWQMEGMKAEGAE